MTTNLTAEQKRWKRLYEALYGKIQVPLDKPYRGIYAGRTDVIIGFFQFNHTSRLAELLNIEKEQNDN